MLFFGVERVEVMEEEEEEKRPCAILVNQW